jgi:hypothetical protein
LVVDCVDEPCSRSVGVIYHDVGALRQRCTATLIAPDRVLTAGHCLPPDTRAVGDRCAGVSVAFGATAGQPAEHRRCVRVIVATGVDNPATLTPDYAVVLLDRPSERPVLAVDPAPLAPGEVVTIFAAAPERDHEGHLALRARRCRVEGPGEAVEALGARARDVAWLALCPIRPGNSGAPVVDDEGRVRGLVHGGSPPFFGRAVMTRAEDFSSTGGTPR